MAYTEFCCRSGGSNLNAGTLTGSSSEPGTAASFTYASGTWVASTGVFTVASGNPQTDGVAVGDFASVYADGSSVTGFVGRVTARDTTTITVSLTAKAGTAPTDGTSNRTVKIGGAWAGPNGTSGFPFTLVERTLTNTSFDRPRVNYKNDATYSITAAITASNAGPITWQGYTSAYADGGRAVLDGGTSGASYVLLTVSGANHVLSDWELRNNGATGLAAGLVCSANEVYCRGVVVHDVRGSGFKTDAYVVHVECEAYACNQSNTEGSGGFQFSVGTCLWLRCISHDNTGSNNDGWRSINGVGLTLISCISESNGRHGIALNATRSEINLWNCDFYNNAGDGAEFTIDSGNWSTGYIENCNFVKNGGYGVQINTVSTTGVAVLARNCGYGSGTQANTSGQSSGLSEETGAITYAADVTPWNAPTTGDFRVSLAAAKGTGRGSFTETQASYTGTVAYPDVGAGQHADTGSSGVKIAQAMTGGFVG